MKKILALCFILLMLCTLPISASAYENEAYYKGLEGAEINVFNWGEYISDTYEDGMLDVNKEFEKLTGIKVNYVTYESNEDMYPKIKNGGASYDIISPSDYMIGKLIAEDILRPLNFDNIPN